MPSMGPLRASTANCGVGYTAGINPDRAEAAAGLYVEIILRGLRRDPA